MWNKELPSILPKWQFGRRKPSAIQWEKFIGDVWQFVIPFYQWTSTLARWHIVKVRLPANCASPMSSNWRPRLFRCYLGSKQKLAFGKLFRPWRNREEFQSHTVCDSYVASSQTNPRHSVEPNQQLFATFCAVIRWCFLTATSSMPTCANWKTMHRALQIYVNIAGCEEFLFGMQLPVRYQSLGGRQRSCEHQIQIFCRYKGLGPWLEETKCHITVFGDSYTFLPLCFAPARVRVKHYGYDPIGKWGKWNENEDVEAHKMWNKELLSILPKRQFGRRKPSGMQWKKLICDVWQFVIPLYQWTSTLPRRHVVKVRLPASYASPVFSNWWPRLLGCYLGSKGKLAFGKLFRPWRNREEFQSHTVCDSYVASSQTNPRHSVEPNQQLFATFCAVIRWCFLTATSSMPTCANWKAMRRALQIYVNIAGCEEFLFGMQLPVRYQSLGGRQRSCEHQIQIFCRYKGLGPWLEETKCHITVFGDSYTFLPLCFAPARVRVKHYGYDPIGKWGKWNENEDVEAHKMWNKELLSILPKRQFGRRKPSGMQWKKLICDVWQFVIPLYQWTSTLPRRHVVKVRLPASYASPVFSNWWPRLLGCYLGSKGKLAFGKLFRPWWNREKFQSHTDSVIHSSHGLRGHMRDKFCIRPVYIIRFPLHRLDAHSSNSKLQCKIYAAGITWETGLTLPETPISGSTTTPTSCRFPSDDFPFHVFIRSLYIQCVFAFHFLCPKWAAARHTGSTSKKILFTACVQIKVTLWRAGTTYMMDSIWKVRTCPLRRFHECSAMLLMRLRHVKNILRFVTDMLHQLWYLNSWPYGCRVHGV